MRGVTFPFYAEAALPVSSGRRSGFLVAKRFFANAVRFCEESAGTIYCYLQCGMADKMSENLLLSSLLVLRTGGLAPLIPCF